MMKRLKVMGAYFRGIRFSALVLILMITVSTYFGTIVLARINYLSECYKIVGGTTLENAYYMQIILPDSVELTVESFQLDEETVEWLNSCDAVDYVYTTGYASGFKYSEDDASFSLVLVDPKLVEAFPELKAVGFDFSENHEGLLIGGDGLVGYSDDAVELYASYPEGHSELFDVIGQLKRPFYFFSFTGTTTGSATASLFVDSGGYFFIEYNEENAACLSEIAYISFDMNYIVSFSSDADEGEVDEVLTELSQYRVFVSLDEIIENTRSEMYDTIKEELPMMLFFLLVSLVSYLSMAVLTAKKKEHEMAVYYLCGVSRGECAAIVCAANCVISVIPALINVILAAVLTGLDRTGHIDLDGYMYKSNVYFLIIGYFLLTVVVSVISTAASMSQKTPLSFLRGKE